MMGILGCSKPHPLPRSKTKEPGIDTDQIQAVWVSVIIRKLLDLLIFVEIMNE